ncbi:MAG: hypothetical protein AAF218_10515 [Pseudomonadota bacterium]
MSTAIANDPIVAAQVMDLVTRERRVSLSRREWKHRLAGFGYGIRETGSGDVVETLPRRVQICTLPPELGA